MCSGNPNRNGKGNCICEATKDKGDIAFVSRVLKLLSIVFSNQTYHTSQNICNSMFNCQSMILDGVHVYWLLCIIGKNYKFSLNWSIDTLLLALRPCILGFNDPPFSTAVVYA